MSRESFKYKRAGGIKTARVLVIWGSLAAGVVAMLMTNSLINEAKQTATVEVPPQMETESVLVVTADVPVGQKLDPATLKWQKWPAEGVGESFVTEAAKPEAITEFGGRIVGTPISAGEPLIARKLHEQKTGGFLSAALPSGQRAYSVKISPETGAGGFILPDDRVDVLLTYKEAANSVSEKVTYSSETVLRNIRVLAIDQSAQDKTTRKAEEQSSVAIGKTATLALSQRQAEIVALAEVQGNISLTLRSLADAETDASEDVGAAIAMRVHRPGQAGVSVTRFEVSASQPKTDKTKLAMH